jgi:ectoine hydroxylase-related dioxygenase (phytanoyl-CoA dioxygenase family)
MSSRPSRSAARSPAPEVDSGTVAAFRRDGAVVVRGLVTAEELAQVRDGIERVLAEPGERFLVASADDDAGRFVEDFRRWQDVPEYEAFVRGSRAAAVAGALTGSATIRLHHDHTLVKEPGTRQRTPWHQDQPYYDIDGTQTCSMWLPVDPVSRSATLEFVVGSHLGPWLLPRTFLDDQARWFPEGSLQELPDVDAEVASGRLEVVGWELEPGDAVFFSMLALHTAGGVEGPHRRRAFSVRFVGDDVVHAPRSWRTSPDFPGLADELPAGAPLDHPLFPVVWTADALPA